MIPKTEMNLFNPDFNANPHPTYRRLRSETPVCRVPLPDRREAWLITRYDDVLSVLRDEMRFSTRAMLSQTGELPELSAGARNVMSLFDLFMSSNDPPDHTRLRTQVQRAFTARLIGGLQPYLEDLADELLDAVEKRASATGMRTMDLISDFAFPLPVTVIMRLLGIPREDRDDLRRWSKALVKFDRSPRSAEALAPEVDEFIDYVRTLLDTKRRDPADDLLTALVGQRGDCSLTELELVSMTFGLIFSGHETTTHLVGNGVLSLLDHPAELAKLRTDPSLIVLAVEELLRYDGPVEVRRRLATEDVEVGGELIRRGDLVLLSVAAANRDPAHFPRPEDLDVTRVENPHLAFGRGIHACLGASLARLEAQTAVATLLRRMPDLTPAVPREELSWRPSGLHLRGLEALPLRF